MGQRHRTQLLHISDLHFGLEEHKEVGSSFLDHLRTREESLDVIVASGDFCFAGETGSLRRAADFLADVAKAASVPLDRVFVVPGNHDFNRLTFWLSPHGARRNFDRHLGRFTRLDQWIYLDDLNLSLYFFDSNAFSWRDRLAAWFVGGVSRAIAGGKVGRAALERLRTQHRELTLQQDPSERYRSRRCLGSFKVAVCHHHPLPLPVIGEDQLGVLLDAGDVLNALADADFDLVLHGHQHYPVHAEINYWPLWEGAHRTRSSLLVSGAGTLCKKERGATRANHFAIIGFEASNPRKIPVAVSSISNLYGTWMPIVDVRQTELERDWREALVFSDDTLDVIANAVGHKRKRNIIDTKVLASGSVTECSQTICESRVSQLRQVHYRFETESDQSMAFSFAAMDNRFGIRAAADADEHGFFYVYFDVPLSPGQTAEYRLTVTSPPGSLKWNRSELAEVRKKGKLRVPKSLEGHEFSGHLVSIPTDELVLSVEFESGLKVIPEVTAWIDETGVEHRTETQRIRKLKTPAGKAATRWIVSIPSPIFGARYIWTWPLPQ